MNKRLRRILRRRQSSRNNSTLQQNTSEKTTLSSLLAERSSAKPNYYFHTNGSLQSDSVLKKSDEKADEKTILIVDDGNQIVEKAGSDIEIELKPMDKETFTAHSNADVSKDDGVHFESIPKMDSTPSAAEGTKRRFDSFENGALNVSGDRRDQGANIFAETEKLKMLPRFIKTSRKGENPYSFPPKPVLQNDVGNFNKPLKKDEIKDTPSRASTSIDDDLLQETTQGFRNETFTSNSTGLMSPTDARGSPTFEMAVLAHCGRDSEVRTKTVLPPKPPIRMENLKLLGRELSLSEKLPVRPPKVSCDIPHALPPHLHSRLQSSVSQTSIKADCSCTPSFHQCPGTSDPIFHPRLHSQNTCGHCCSFGHHQQSNRVCSPWSNSNMPEHSTCASLHRHGHEVSSFPACCSGHGFRSCDGCCVCGACSRNNSMFQMKRQFRHHSCSARHSFSSHLLEETNPATTERISPVIFVSIPGEAQPKTIELPLFVSSEESINSEGSTSMECDFMEGDQNMQTSHACKRHLEETRCTDYKVHCERRAIMAPSVTLMSSLQETCGFSTETHCPCCYRIIRERKDTHFDQACPDEMNLNSIHQYSNGNSTGIQKSLGHFEISPRSYTKLLAYVKIMQAAARQRRLPSEHFENRSSFHGFERRSVNCSNELVFLNRKPTRAHNEYSTFAERTLSFSAYQNQIIADTVQLAKVLETVEECPWYWGEMSNVEAKRTLRGSPIGTFMLRDSSDPRYLFSASVMTSRGPTSIRVVYSDGYFRFDSDGDKTTLSGQKSSAPSDNVEISKHRKCVVHMILHYTNHLLSKTHKPVESAIPSANVRTHNSGATSSDETNKTSTNTSDKNEKSQFMCSWVGRTGKKVMSVSISKPLPKMKISSLQQLSRSYVNKHLSLWKNPGQANDLPITVSLQKYLKKYPYPV